MEDILRVQALLNKHQHQDHIQQLIVGGYQLPRDLTPYDLEDVDAGLPKPVPVQEITLEETLNIMNEEPELVQQLILEDAATGGVYPDEYIGVDSKPSEVQGLLDDFRWTPSERHLLQQDYRRIKQYLRGKRNFSQLTPDQARLVETLKYDNLNYFDVDGGGGFTSARDGVRFANLREQLLGRLEGDSVMSKEAINKFSDIDADFPEIFKDSYIFPSKAEDPKIKIPQEQPEIEMEQIGPSAPQEEILGRLWMLEDDDIMKKFVDDMFESEYDADLYNDHVFRSRIAQHEHMFLKSQNYQGTWDEYQEEFNMFDDNFEDMWAYLGEKTDDAEAWEKFVEGDVDPHEVQPKGLPLGDDEFVSEVPFEYDEGDAPKGVPVEKPTPVKPFIDDDVSAVLNKIGIEDKPDLDRMLAMSNEGDLFLDSSLIEKYLEEGSNLWLGLTMMPAISTIQGMIDQIIPGSSRWINIGMATMDVITSGNPIGLAIQSVMEIVQEVQVDAQRKRDNDFSQANRGSRYGFFKNEAGEWKPSILNTTVKSTSFGSRSSVQTIEYGDTILFQKDHDGNVYPVVTNSHEYIIQEPDQFMEDTPPTWTSFIDVQGKDPFYSKEFLNDHDILRRWFFLTPEQEQEVFAGDSYAEIVENLEGFKPEEATYNKYQSNLLDWQKAIVLKRSLTYGGDEDMTEWDPSTGLRRVTTEERDMGYGAFFKDPRFSDSDHLEAHMKNTDLPEEEWMIDQYLPTLIQSLVSSQRAAAREAGYLDKFGTDPIWDKYYSKGLTPPKTKHSQYYTSLDDTKYAGVSGQQSWSANYLKYDRDIPAAHDFDELQRQINNIAQYDETQTTRDYLTNKSITRYFVDQLNNRGRGEDFMNSIINSTTGSLMGEDNSDYGTYAMPWSNKSDQNSMVLGKDDEFIITGLLSPYQQKPYKAWMATRGDNYLSDQTWDAHFVATDDDKPEETVKPEKDKPDEQQQPILPFIYVNGVKYHNPDYVDPELTEVKQDAIKESGEYVPTDETKFTGISDWENALKEAKIWSARGLSGNPDDYYSKGQNDNSRPAGFTYTPPIKEADPILIDPIFGSGRDWTGDDTQVDWTMPPLDEEEDTERKRGQHAKTPEERAAKRDEREAERLRIIEERDAKKAAAQQAKDDRI